ncbi:hypothetical protein [Tautonia sociabilis]|uniref:Uncharacterized protein n=1 Tax=Tautonia sociabilis TaxID=2080755 RepID=A0A432MIV6_9BACT|nr:hypothetical protein [Tautonia sociabilis]RUL87160.1 hypothetical protein TsocGM_13865 [Tautonia sociabilis]
MPRFPIDRAVWSLAVAALLTAVGPTSRAQGPFTGGAGMAGLSPPSFAPNGVWARVITATPKWLVLEDAEGRQYPVSFSAIDLFVIRWPANPALAPPGTMAEVTGFDLNNGSILAGHVDLYEGSARSLVSPTSLVLVGYNRVMVPTNPYQMSTFGQFTLLPGEELIPQRRHLVGPLVSGAPLVIAGPGNQAAQVVPGAGGMSVTQVTIGSPSFVRPGDMVWCLPLAAGPQTLALRRLVVYKTIPMAQFVP